jgi:hypothetical protein
LLSIRSLKTIWWMQSTDQKNGRKKHTCLSKKRLLRSSSTMPQNKNSQLKIHWRSK